MTEQEDSIDRILPPGVAGMKQFQEDVLNIVATGKSEADRAADLKGRAQKLMIELCAVMDEGLRDGLMIRWNGTTVNPFTGKHEILDLHIEKRF